MFTCPGKKQHCIRQAIRQAKGDGGEGAKHGLWARGPLETGTATRRLDMGPSGWEQCLEGEFGYRRGVKCVGRQTVQ